MHAHENPFRTSCVEAQIKFQPAWLGTTWETIEKRFEKLCIAGHNCVVVGPHGSGKTTFLESFKTQLQQRGLAVDLCRVFRGPGGQIEISEPPLAKDGSILLLDSAGYNNWQHHRRLRELSKRYRILETRHRRGLGKILLRTTTRPEMLEACIRRLHPNNGYSQHDIRRIFRRHNGNLRDALSECYESLMSQP